jgi:hypothetical protein
LLVEARAQPSSPIAPRRLEAELELEAQLEREAQNLARLARVAAMLGLDPAVLALVEEVDQLTLEPAVSAFATQV